MSFFSLDPSDHLSLQEFPDGHIGQGLEIRNTSEEPLAFKIQTTSPNCYSVKPNSGIVLPGGQETVKIVWEPKRDKFMVMTTPVSETENPNVDSKEFWAHAETLDNKLEKKRIRCSFLSNTKARELERKLQDSRQKIQELELLLRQSKTRPPISILNNYHPVAVAVLVGGLIVLLLWQPIPGLFAALVATLAFLASMWTPR